MAASFHQIHLHVVFSTMQRRPLLTSAITSELYTYFCGILGNKGRKYLAGNGMEDHVHLLFSAPPKDAPADLVRVLKANSSKWINRKFAAKGRFQWQNGYSVFSVSHSKLSNIHEYIQNQQQHHAKRDFQAELRALLKKHEVEVDERYVLG
jgi:putative transposase